MSQLVLQFTVPNMIWLISIFSSDPLDFPIDSIEKSFAIFPKVVVETSILSAIYSEDVAIRYGLTYANSFFLGLAVLFLGVMAGILAKPLITEEPKEHLAAKNTKPLTFRLLMIEAPHGGAVSVKPSIVPALAFVAVLSYFIFFQAITFYPSPNVTHTRLLYAHYVAFSVAFPLFFFLLYLLIAGRIARMRSQFTHHSRKQA